MQKTIKEAQKEKLEVFSELIKNLALSSYKGDGSIGVMGAMFIPPEPSKASKIKERQEGKAGLAIINLTPFFVTKESQKELPKELSEIFEDLRPVAFATIAEALMAESSMEDAFKPDGSVKSVSDFTNKIDILNISLESHDMCKFIIFEVTKLGSLKLRKETQWESKKSTGYGGNMYNLLKKDYSAFGEGLHENLKTNLN